MGNLSFFDFASILLIKRSLCWPFNTFLKMSVNNSTKDFFARLFENRLSKFVSLSFSVPFSYIAAFLVFFIIWHEKNGSDARRTILNLLLTTCWWVPLLWMSVVQQFDFLRYLYGPLPIGLCYLNSFFRHFLTMMAVVLLDCIIIGRHVLIFWLKNPAGKFICESNKLYFFSFQQKSNWFHLIIFCNLSILVV